jgi:hypothetical protein
MKRNILTLTFTLILSLAAVAAYSQSNEFAVPLSDPSKRGKLNAHLNYGSITVKGTARKDVLVKYSEEKDGEDRHREGRNHNNDRTSSESKVGLRWVGGGGLDLEASENANQVRVKSDSWNVKMFLEIEVPVGFDLEVHTYNDGDLVINNVQGSLELKNYNGEITATGISGSVVANTYNGAIKVTFDKITEGTPMSYSTYNGDIDITLPPTTKATFKMKTEQGEILTDFDMNVVSSGPVQKKDPRSGTYKLTIDEWKRADLNGGGAEFSMKTYNGDVIVRKKK